MDHCASALHTLACPSWSHTWTFQYAATPEFSGLPRYTMWIESGEPVFPLSQRSPVLERSAVSDEATKMRYAVCRKLRALGFTGVNTQLSRGSVTSIPRGSMRYSQRNCRGRTAAAPNMVQARIGRRTKRFMKPQIGRAHVLNSSHANISYAV